MPAFYFSAFQLNRWNTIKGYNQGFFMDYDTNIMEKPIERRGKAQA